MTANEKLKILTERYDFINWAAVCRKAQINYQVFKNSKRKDFCDMNENRCQRVINALLWEMDRLTRFVASDVLQTDLDMFLDEED